MSGVMGVGVSRVWLGGGWGGQIWSAHQAGAAVSAAAKRARCGDDALLIAPQLVRFAHPDGP